MFAHLCTRGEQKAAQVSVLWRHWLFSFSIFFLVTGSITHNPQYLSHIRPPFASCFSSMLRQALNGLELTTYVGWLARVC